MIFGKRKKAAAKAKGAMESWGEQNASLDASLDAVGFTAEAYFPEDLPLDDEQNGSVFFFDDAAQDTTEYTPEDDATWGDVAGATEIEDDIYEENAAEHVVETADALDDVTTDASTSTALDDMLADDAPAEDAPANDVLAEDAPAGDEAAGDASMSAAEDDAANDNAVQGDFAPGIDDSSEPQLALDLGIEPAQRKNEFVYTPSSASQLELNFEATSSFSAVNADEESSEEETKTTVAAEDKVEVIPATELETDPATTAEAEVAPVAEPEVEPATTAEAEVAPVAEPEVEPATTAEAEVAPVAEPEVEPAAETATAPTKKVKPRAKRRSAPKVETELEPALVNEPETELASTNEPEVEPLPDDAPSIEDVFASESESAPVLEPEPAVESEPAPEADSAPASEVASAPEPASEPVPASAPASASAADAHVTTEFPELQLLIEPDGVINNDDDLDAFLLAVGVDAPKKKKRTRKRKKIEEIATPESDSAKTPVGVEVQEQSPVAFEFDEASARKNEETFEQVASAAKSNENSTENDVEFNFIPYVDAGLPMVDEDDDELRADVAQALNSLAFNFDDVFEGDYAYDAYDAYDAPALEDDAFTAAFMATGAYGEDDSSPYAIRGTHYSGFDYDKLEAQESKAKNEPLEIATIDEVVAAATAEFNSYFEGALPKREEEPAQEKDYGDFFAEMDLALEATAAFAAAQAAADDAAREADDAAREAETTGDEAGSAADDAADDAAGDAQAAEATGGDAADNVANDALDDSVVSDAPASDGAPRNDASATEEGELTPEDAMQLALDALDAPSSSDAFDAATTDFASSAKDEWAHEDAEFAYDEAGESFSDATPKELTASAQMRKIRAVDIPEVENSKPAEVSFVVDDDAMLHTTSWSARSLDYAIQAANDPAQPSPAQSAPMAPVTAVASAATATAAVVSASAAQAPVATPRVSPQVASAGNAYAAQKTTNSIDFLAKKPANSAANIFKEPVVPFTKDELEACLDLLYLCGCALARELPSDERLYAMNLPLIYSISTKEHLGALIGSVLKDANISEPERQRWNAAYRDSLQFNSALTQEGMRIFKWMDSQKIWYAPLTGAVLQSLYPQMGQREMRDFDVLYDAKYAEIVRDFMLRNGYNLVQFYYAATDVYRLEPLYSFTYHRALFTDSEHPEWEAYFRSVKDRMQLNANTTCGYRLSYEDLYMHTILHTQMNFEKKQTGLRLMCDIKSFFNRYAGKVQWDYILSECAKLEIGYFESLLRSCAVKLLNPSWDSHSNPLTAQELKLLESMVHFDHEISYEESSPFINGDELFDWNYEQPHKDKKAARAEKAARKKEAKAQAQAEKAKAKAQPKVKAKAKGAKSAAKSKARGANEPRETSYSSERFYDEAYDSPEVRFDDMPAGSYAVPASMRKRQRAVPEREEMPPVQQSQAMNMAQNQEQDWEQGEPQRRQVQGESQRRQVQDEPAWDAPAPDYVAEATAPQAAREVQAAPSQGKSSRGLSMNDMRNLTLGMQEEDSRDGRDEYETRGQFDARENLRRNMREAQKAYAEQRNSRDFAREEYQQAARNSRDFARDEREYGYDQPVRNSRDFGRDEYGYEQAPRNSRDFGRDEYQQGYRNSRDFGYDERGRGDSRDGRASRDFDRDEYGYEQAPRNSRDFGRDGRASQDFERDGREYGYEQAARNSREFERRRYEDEHSTERAIARYSQQNWRDEESGGSRRSQQVSHPGSAQFQLDSPSERSRNTRRR